MGGGAIKKNGVSICSRLPRAAYLAVKNHVLSTLAPHVTACEGVLELPGKTDFGDLDVLYCHDAEPSKGVPTIPGIVKEYFGVGDPTHLVRHGPVTSFAFNIKTFLEIHCPEVPTPATEYFQIDLIRSASMAQLSMCRFYFGYGDVGGILGRVFNFYGMKFGEAGLWCELFSNTVAQLKGEGSEEEGTAMDTDPEIFGHVPRVEKVAAVVAAAVDAPPVLAGGAELLAKAEEKDIKKRKEGVVDPTATLGRIPLVCDPAAICSYAGLDYAKWCRGFNTVDEVVHWLIDCHLYMPSIFDRLNYEHMQRAHKRPFYQKFLGHINMTPGKAGSTQVRCNKQLEAIRHFKQEGRLMEILRDIEVSHERRAKFNGKLLSAVLFEVQSQAASMNPPPKPLDGKPLGQAIFDFKTILLAKKGEPLPAAEAKQPSSGKTVTHSIEAGFNKVLDGATVEDIHYEMHYFAATYTPAPPTVSQKQ